MPRRASPFGLIAVSQQRIVNRAVAMERAQMASLYEGTASPSDLVASQPQRVGTELLGLSDPTTIARLQAYDRFLSQDERATVDSRATRAGGSPVFGAPPDPPPHYAQSLRETPSAPAPGAGPVGTPPPLEGQ